MKITVFARHIQKYVTHGRTETTPEGVTFIREMATNCMRYSDRTFCINLEAIPKLDSLGVTIIEFRVKYADSIKYHQIAYKDMDEFEVKINEYGEENIRIPMAMTKIVHTYNTVKAEKKKEVKVKSTRFLKDVRKHLGAVWSPPK